MKKRLLFFILGINMLLFILIGCTKPSSQNPNTPDASKEGTHSLVVYFSWSNHTKDVASIIANQVHANIVELIPEHPYTQDYSTLLDIAKDELQNNARPNISPQSKIQNLDEYDVIFLGFPIWHAREPMIIHTFLESYDFKGKRIIPFSTSGSSAATTAYHALADKHPEIEASLGLNLTSRELVSANTIISNWVEDLQLIQEQKEDSMYIKVNHTILTVSLVDNSSTKALKELLMQDDITIDMHDYGHFEKVGPLGVTLPRNDESITTTAGDLILYQGNSFVIYYDTNSWNFTRLGRIENITQADLIQLLGKGNVTITLTLKKE